MVDLYFICLHFSFILVKRFRYGYPVVALVVFLTFLNPSLAAQDRTAFIDVRNVQKQLGLRRGSAELSSAAGLQSNAKGKFAKIGAIRKVQGRLHLISEKCGDQNAPSLNVPKEWIGVLHYSLTDTDVDNNTKGCPSVADRVRTALLFGASAIIILTLNPHILKELDVSQLFSQPVVVLENIDNITCLLSILISKIKVKAKILYNTSHYDLLNFSTLTLWATCGRALWATSDNIGGDFICLEQQGAQGKANPGDFWNFFYSGLCTLMLLLKLKTGQQNLAANSTDDGAECHVKKLAYQALSVIRIRRYTESDYSDDLCAVCLDQYQLRQKIRVLPCCHEFHTKCVDPWLIQCGTCPLCKQDITDKDNF